MARAFFKQCLSRNFFIRWDPAAGYEVDVAIYTTSPNARILHNAALVQGAYPNAIEVRFAGATGVEVGHNLTDAAIQPRNGAAPILIDNEIDAQSEWFVDEATANLRLTELAGPAINQVFRRAEAGDDFSAYPRRIAPALTDLGAFEYGPGIIFTDRFEQADLRAGIPGNSRTGRRRPYMSRNFRGINSFP